MIITCPHCQTKYQVTYDAIGSAGRKVQCAHCHEAWQQPPLPHEKPSPDESAAIDAMTEDGFDEAMKAEEKAVAAALVKRLEKEKALHSEAGKVDPAVIRRRQQDFSRRQNAVNADLPLARARRAARIVAFCVLIAVATVAYFARVQIVERYPAMAGVYETVGLDVNVVGLEFSEVTTLRTLRDGKEVLLVSAQIVGTMPEPKLVPPVVVTLLGEHGEGIYEWSVAPAARDLMAGERTTFDTQLTTPPGNAARVRLSFSSGGAMGNAEPQTEATEQQPAQPTSAEVHPPQTHETTSHNTTEHH